MGRYHENCDRLKRHCYGPSQPSASMDRTAFVEVIFFMFVDTQRQYLSKELWGRMTGVKFCKSYEEKGERWYGGSDDDKLHIVCNIAV